MTCKHAICRQISIITCLKVLILLPYEVAAGNRSSCGARVDLLIQARPPGTLLTTTDESGGGSIGSATVRLGLAGVVGAVVLVIGHAIPISI